MNFLVFNKSAENLKAAIYGQHNQNVVAVAADEDGKLMFSPASQITVTASNLDIRNLTSARDTVNVIATDFDIRSLNGARDSVAISAKAFIEARATLSVPANATLYLLTYEVGPYSQNSYFLRNTGGGSVSVALEIAPVNDNAYYVSSGVTGVSAGNNFLAAVATLMRYARLRVETGSATIGVDAFYNGRA